MPGLEKNIISIPVRRKTGQQRKSVASKVTSKAVQLAVQQEIWLLLVGWLLLRQYAIKPPSFTAPTLPLPFGSVLVSVV